MFSLMLASALLADPISTEVVLTRAPAALHATLLTPEGPTRAAAWAEVVADPEVARLLESVGFDVDSAREQRPDEGWTTHVVRRRVALDAGAAEETADDWAATPLPDRKLAKWVASGVRPSDAAGWFERDLRPSEAARWSAAGFTPAGADAWRATGVDPDIAARRRDAGVRPATPD